MQQRPVHFLHPRRDVRRHVDVNRRPARPTAPPSRPVSAMVFSRERARRLQRRDHVRRGAAGADAERDVARPAQRLDLAREHALERVVVRRRSSARSCRSSAPPPPAPTRSRSKRPTSSAATCCASAALPPLPNTSSLPPPPQRVDDCRRRVEHRLRIRRPSRARAARWSRRTSIGAARRSCHPRVSRSFSTLARNSSSVTCSGSRGPRRHPDLHRIVLAQRIAFPVLGHQQPPRIGMAVERRCRTDPRPRARASWPPARRRSPSRRAHRRRAAAPSAAARSRFGIDTRM